jgi:hypothetical protein
MSRHRPADFIAAALAEAPVPGPVDAAIAQAVADSVSYLASPLALEHIAQDPYWPKWEGPWWQMRLLQELGWGTQIPPQAAEAMARAMTTHYLPDFPVHEHELPPGTDPYRQVLCHCALGCMAQVLDASGIDLPARWPTAWPWLLRYQLPDGGLNCDEGAYTRPVPRSSVISTVPTLEAMLEHTHRPFTAAERQFLDRGAAYLIERRLCRSVSKGGLIDPAWLQPIFPRFYEYDVLRGARFLVNWATKLARPLPWAALDEALTALREAARDHGLRPRAWLAADRTLRRDAAGGWRRGEPAGSFALLEWVSAPDRPSPWLQQEWRELLINLQGLEERGLLLTEVGSAEGR